jgi:PsbP
MNKKVFLGLLVIVVTLAVATAGCTFSTNPSSGGASPSASAVPQNITGYSTYKNATAGVRIQYPSGWGVTEGGSKTNVVTFHAPDYTNVQVISSPVSGQRSLTELHNMSVNEILNITSLNYTLVSTENTTLAGMPAYNSTLTTTIAGIPMTQIFETTLKNNQGYALIFSTSSELLPKYQNDFNNMTNSFAITS